MVKRIHHNNPKFIGEKRLNILIVEDHPLTAKGYELLLQKAVEHEELSQITVKRATSLQEAYALLDSKADLPHLVLLDIRMKAFEEKNWFSGEDFGLHLRQVHPNIKIVVMTSLVDAHRLQGILTNLNPEGFLLKTEIDDMVLVNSVKSVLKNIPYFSPSILRLIKNQFLSGIRLNKEEKEFLYLLSKGVPSKDIPQHLPWSLSKVEKQKRLLREKLGAKYSNVLSLANKAKELGII